MKTWVWLTSVLVIAIGVVEADVSAEELLKYLINPEPRITLKPKITTADRAAAHGYPAETHEVVTEDGYVITMFRIPYSHKLQNQNEYRPVVLLQHGLFSCSDAWIGSGPNDSIGYLLADAGYDVWFGNSRGTTYGRKHISRSLDHPYFWRFSWHEIAYYDVTAMIDYALAKNGQGQKAIHYVGHSQGSTVFFALMSTRPEYNEKIKTAHMLAPVAFMTHITDLMFRTLAPIFGHHNTYSAIFADQEFLPFNELFTKLAYNACIPQSPLYGLCTSIANMLDGPVGNTNTTALPIMFENHPSGASTSQVCHYLQEQQSDCFCQYDYGVAKNLRLYGQPTPPDYPLEKITSEVHLWYSDNDDMAAIVDVERLAEMLPNKEMHHMEDPNWTHRDFAVHLEIRKYVNDPIISIMDKYEQNM